MNLQESLDVFERELHESREVCPPLEFDPEGGQVGCTSQDSRIRERPKKAIPNEDEGASWMEAAVMQRERDLEEQVIGVQRSLEKLEGLIQCMGSSVESACSHKAMRVKGIACRRSKADLETTSCASSQESFEESATTSAVELHVPPGRLQPSNARPGRANRHIHFGNEEGATRKAGGPPGNKSYSPGTASAAGVSLPSPSFSLPCLSASLLARRRRDLPALAFDS